MSRNLTRADPAIGIVLSVSSERANPIRKHLRGLLLQAKSPEAASLIFTCRVQKKQFDSGIRAVRSAIAHVEHIAVRMRCPVCEQLHLFVEKGELVE